MPVPFPIGFDPITEAWMGNFMSDSEIRLAALIGLTACAWIGYGAFFTYSAAVAAPAIPLTTVTITYTATHPITGAAVTGVARYCTNGIVMSASQRTFLATAQAMALSGTAPVTINPILTSWGFTKFSIEGIIALSLWERTIIPGYYGNIGNSMGPGLGGGSQAPPGFPGFGLGGNQGVSNGGVGGVYGCSIANGVSECYWYY